MAQSNLPPRKESRKKRIWPWVLVITCFLTAALAGAYFASSSLSDKPEAITKQAEKEGLLTAKDKATVMIMGVDERADDVGRSDTLMVATIDPRRKQAALFSVPRDTRVKIKGHGFDKINAAYAYGGERLTKDTVEGFLGVNIDHYVIVNTKSFQRIIDAIGGIDIYVEKRMYYEDPWDDDGGLLIDLQPGMQHMDGKTAVTYVRYRDEEGDIGRVRRQQKFMEACMDKVVSPGIITKLPSVISEIMDSVQTDLSLRQMLEFAGSLKEAKDNGLKTEIVPGRGMYISGVSYWIPDVSEMRTLLAGTLDITMNSSVRERMERADEEYESSIPAGATELPADDTSIGSTRSYYRDREEPRSTSSGRRSQETGTTGTTGGSVSPVKPETSERPVTVNRDKDERPGTAIDTAPHSTPDTPPDRPAVSEGSSTQPDTPTRGGTGKTQ